MLKPAEALFMPIDKIKVLLVAGEAVPFAKVGGLADVVGALGKEIGKNNTEVRIVIPKYTVVYDYIEQNNIKINKVRDIKVSVEDREIKAKIEEIVYDDVVYYFIDSPFHFKREGIYIDSKTRTDYSDSLERFVFFCKAVLEGAKTFSFKPDIIQCNDWQTGLVPVYLKTLYKLDPFFKDTYSIYSIHNLSYQGIFPVEQFTITGLDWKYFSFNELEYYGHLNLLKGGIVFSDVIVTVSETYAKEIQTSEFGNGLEGILKNKALQRRLYGIVNGADYKDWNPEIDVYLKTKYNINFNLSSLGNKKKIKELFLKDCGLADASPDVPLIGMISRLVDQKGFDLVFEIINELLKMDVYFVVLGTGKTEYESRFKSLKERYPNQTAVFIEFNIPLSHYIESAADIFMMPSRFEPCGLNQLYSLKYGTIPVVRYTGGLADTVKDGKTGFVFSSYSPEEFFNTLIKAIQTYKNEPEKWGKMVENAMSEDWSWNRAAKKYCELYKSLISDQLL
jgi:starch synthase